MAGILWTGTSGDDNRIGGSDNDTLFGADGNDRLNGALGSDYLSGDNGNDTLIGAGQNDTLIGGAGNDELTGSAGTDVFQFNFTTETITTSTTVTEYFRDGDTPNANANKAAWDNYVTGLNAWRAQEQAEHGADQNTATESTTITVRTDNGKAIRDALDSVLKKVLGKFEYALTKKLLDKVDFNSPFMKNLFDRLDDNPLMKNFLEKFGYGGTKEFIYTYDKSFTHTETQSTDVISGEGNDTVFDFGAADVLRFTGISEEQAADVLAVSTSDVNGDSFTDTVIAFEGGSITLLSVSIADTAALLADSRVEFA